MEYLLVDVGAAFEPAPALALPVVDVLVPGALGPPSDFRAPASCTLALSLPSFASRAAGTLAVVGFVAAAPASAAFFGAAAEVPATLDVVAGFDAVAAGFAAVAVVAGRLVGGLDPTRGAAVPLAGWAGFGAVRDAVGGFAGAGLGAGFLSPAAASVLAAAVGALGFVSGAAGLSLGLGGVAVDLAEVAAGLAGAETGFLAWEAEAVDALSAVDSGLRGAPTSFFTVPVAPAGFNVELVGRGLLAGGCFFIGALAVVAGLAGVSAFVAFGDGLSAEGAFDLRAGDAFVPTGFVF